MGYNFHSALKTPVLLQITAGRRESVEWIVTDATFVFVFGFDSEEGCIVCVTVVDRPRLVVGFMQVGKRRRVALGTQTVVFTEFVNGYYHAAARALAEAIRETGFTPWMAAVHSSGDALAVKALWHERYLLEAGIVWHCIPNVSP